MGVLELWTLGSILALSGDAECVSLGVLSLSLSQTDMMGRLTDNILGESLSRLKISLGFASLYMEG